ncbi:hypothetical protein [Thermococcus sp.]
MGAIDAFTRTFSLILKNKRLYILTLIMALVLAPIASYLISNEIGTLPVFNQTYNQNNTVGGVIIEEHGATVGEKTGAILDLLKRLAIYGIIALVVGSIFEYAVTKGLLLEPEEKVSLGRLMIEGLRHFPGVVVVNIVYGLLVLVFIGISAIPIVIGALTLPAGAVLILIGLLLLIFVTAFVVGLSSLAIPAYVKNGSIGGAFEGIGLAFRNVLSSAGFGFLLMVGVFAVSIASSPITFVVHYTVSGDIAAYVSAFLQAPFDALMSLFLWAGGVAFYTELKKKEELKKVDEELAELGIEI